MGTFFQDVRYAVRMMVKKPLFTVVAALTLALGIGANTAVFSIVNSMLLRPLPVPRGADLVVLAFQQRHSNVQNQFSVPEYRAIRDQAGGSFAGLGGYIIGIDGFSIGGHAERVMTYYVTGSLFSTLQLTPAAGRLLTNSEGENVNADPVLVLSYTYWKNRFNADPGAVGRKLLVNGTPFTIVGVAPEGFHGPYPILEAQAYLPLGMNTIEGTPADFMENRGYRNLVLMGRLKDGGTLEQARSAVSVMGARLGQLYPETDKDMEVKV